MQILLDGNDHQISWEITLLFKPSPSGTIEQTISNTSFRSQQYKCDASYNFTSCLCFIRDESIHNRFLRENTQIFKDNFYIYEEEVYGIFRKLQFLISCFLDISNITNRLRAKVFYKSSASILNFLPKHALLS